MANTPQIGPDSDAIHRHCAIGRAFPGSALCGGGVTQKARAAEPTAGAGQGAIHLKVRLTTVDGKIITATLNDSATAQDFAALLPLTLSLDDYAATEKIAYLPRRLSTAGVPDGFTPSVGDITYYAPWQSSDLPQGFSLLGEARQPRPNRFRHGESEAGRGA